MKTLATVATLAILTASSVSAEGFYVGAGISQERIKEGLPVSVKSTNAIALIGYDINDMISVEAETSLPVSKNNITDIETETTAEVSIYHTAVFAKLTLPTSGSFKPFARAGMTKVAFKAEDESNYAVLDDTVFSYGIGAEWALSEKFGLRADYTISKFDPYDSSAADINILALSSVYRF